MNRENYYLLLKLDPDKHTTWAAVEPVFKAAKAEWSRLSISHPTEKLKYKQYLKWVPDIERVFKDDAARKQEADDARKAARKQAAEATAELDELVRLTGAKGYLTPDDVKELTKAGAGGKWTEKDVRAAAARAKIPIQSAPPPATEPPEERLDKNNDEKIRKILEFLKKPNLYAFLGEARSTSAATLHKKVDAEYRANRLIANKNDAEVTARGDLLGLCMTVFASEKERQKYDNTLKWLELDEIRKLAEQAGAGEGKISAAVTASLVLRAKKEGISQAKVEEAVREVAARRKPPWVVEVPGVNAVPANLQRCGYCGTVEPAEKTHCGNRECGRPLKLACPKCSATNPTDARSCRCGFALGDMWGAEPLIRAAKVEFQADPAKTKALLQEALTFWPGQAEAVQLLGRISDREKEVQRLVDAVEKERAARRFVAARQRVEDLAREVPTHPRLADLRKEAAAALAAADGHVRRARQCLAAGKPDDAIDAFTEAVRACADCPEAIDGLTRCPPEPVPVAAAAAGLTGVTVTWTPSPSRGQVTYRVVRKAGSQPARPDDGVEVGRVAAGPLADPAAEPGELFHYAVFADRGGVCAARPALAGPVVRLAEVADLRPQVGDRRVELGWTAPPNARRVEVRRQPQTVPRPGTGDPVNTVVGNTATDTGLTNGTPYGYRVAVVFAGPDGKDRATDGVGVVCIPVAPPKPVAGLKVARTGTGGFEVTWAPPPTGEVRVYRVADPRALGYRSGEQLPVADLGRIGKRVPAAGPNAARDRTDGLNALHLLPVTVLGQAAVAGQVVTENWVDDVTRLRAWADGDALRATWDFPDGFDTAVLVYRPDRFPDGPNDPAAARAVWTREQARLNGGFRTPAPNADRAYLVIYTQVNRGGRWEYSPGVRAEVPVGQRRRVRWAVRRQRKWLLPTGPWELTLTPDGPTDLPELVLVASPDGYPLSPTAGYQVAASAARRCGPGDPVVVAFEPPGWFDPRKARVFPRADDDARWLDMIG